MDVFRDTVALRDYLAGCRADRCVAFVPTMGALHAGHRACVGVAQTPPRAMSVVSIFVNPAQFGPGEDLDAYPRTVDRDLDLCRQWGVDVVFVPAVRTMYPVSQSVWVDEEGLTDVLCGAARPGHFRGVATVVMKLFHIVEPDMAVFGQKDAQQALVIRRVVDQLNSPVRIALAAISREPDGLARSSRNAYLSPEERGRATSLYSALCAAGDALDSGERSARRIEEIAKQRMSGAGLDVEYAECRTAVDLCSLEEIAGRVILALAARVGATRLIDNCVYLVDGDRVDRDVALFE